MEHDDYSNMTAEKEDGMINGDCQLVRPGERVKDNSITSDKEQKKKIGLEDERNKIILSGTFRICNVSVSTREFI